MKQSKKIAGFCAVFVLAGAGTAVWASQASFSAGQAIMPWLKFSGDARGAGMGGAGRATGGSVNALIGNPAGLAQLEKRQASFQRDIGVEGLAMDHVAVGMKLGSKTGVALGLDRMSYGTVETYRVDGINLVKGEDINPGGYTFNVGAGAALGWGSSAGATFRLVHEDLGNGGRTLGAYTLGGSWRGMGDRLGLGMAVQNLGIATDGDQMPVNWIAGGEFRMDLVGDQAVTLAVEGDVAPYATEASTYSVGVEWMGLGVLALRSGYRYIGNDGADGLSFGGAVSFNWFKVDYAYLGTGDLGSSHQISLSSSF